MKDVLLKNAMLAQLRIEGWKSTVKDERVSQEIAEKMGADKDAGNYLKRLFPRHAMADINRYASDAKKIFYLCTTPWDDRSWRLLPIKYYDNFSEKIDDLEEKRRKAKKVFLENYEVYKQEAREMLGDLYREEDYISAEEIASKIQMSKRCYPIPDSDHFIVSLAEEKFEEVKNQIEEEINKKINNSVLSLYGRIKDNVDLIVEKIKVDSDDPILFRDSLITNLKETVEWVENLNITQDEGLQKMCADIQKIIFDVDPDELREKNKRFDPEKKKIVANDMSELQKKMNQIFNDKGDNA